MSTHMWKNLDLLNVLHEAKPIEITQDNFKT